MALQPKRRRYPQDPSRDQDSARNASPPRHQAYPMQPQWESALERMLGEAVQQERWHKLRGQGQKLDLDPPAGTPADRVMAHKIMADNNVTPIWIEDRRRILARIDAWRDKLVTWRQTCAGDGLEDPQQWSQQKSLWHQELEDLNKAIVQVNIGIPIWRMAVLTLDFRQELARAGLGSASAPGDRLRGDGHKS